MIAVLEIIRCAAAVALVVVLSALYGVVALMIRHWEKEFEEDENDDSDERGF